jgi:hypothetical protein
MLTSDVVFRESNTNIEISEARRWYLHSICLGCKLAALEVAVLVMASAPFISSLPLHRPALHLLMKMRYGDSDDSDSDDIHDDYDDSDDDYDDSDDINDTS